MLLIVILVLAVSGSSQRCGTKYKVKPDSNSYGRLRICWGSGERPSGLKWYSVCSSTMLNDVAAAVVCRQLGFNSAGNQGTFGVGLHSSFNESFVFRS